MLDSVADCRIALANRQRLVLSHSEFGEVEIEATDDTDYGEVGPGLLLLAMLTFTGLRFSTRVDSTWVGGTMALTLPDDPSGYFDRPTMMLLEDVGNPPVVEVIVRGLPASDGVVDLEPVVAAELQPVREFPAARAVRTVLVTRGFSLRPVRSAGQAWVVEFVGQERGFVEVVRSDVNTFCAPFAVRTVGAHGSGDGVLIYGGPFERYLSRLSVYPPSTDAIRQLMHDTAFDRSGFSYRRYASH